MENKDKRKPKLSFGNHNYFVAECGSRAELALNEVFDVGEFMGKQLGYGEYIALGDGSGGNKNGLGSQKYVLKTSAANVNSDMQKGILRATYYAALGEDEAEGFTLTEMGLTGYAQGGKLANYAAIEPITKKAGEKLAVSVTVHVKVINNSPHAAITGGADNALSKFLLGFAYEPGVKSLYVGYTLYPPQVICRGFEGTMTGTSDYSIEVDETNKCINFEALLVNYSWSEMLYCLNAKPVLRVVWPYTPTIKSNTFAANERGTIMALQRPIDEVVGVMQNGVELSDFVQRRPIIRPTLFKPNLEFKLPPTARFIQESDYRVGAVIADSEIIVVTSKNSCLLQKYRMPYNGEDVGFMLNRKMYFWGEKLRIYEFDDEYSSCTFTEHNIGRGEKGVVVSEGIDLYHIIVRSGNSALRYKMDKGVISLLETTTSNVPFDVLKAVQALCFVGIDGARYCKTLRGNLAEMEKGIDEMFKYAYEATGITGYDNYMCFDSTFHPLACNLAAKNRVHITTPDYKLNQRNYIEHKADKDTLSLVNEIGSGYITADYADMRISDVLKLGEDVFYLIEDGTVKHYVSDEAYTGIYSPSLRAGAATVMYRTRDFAKAPLRQRITLSFNQNL